MPYSITEVFGDEPAYWMGISFETYTYDEDQNMKVKRKGWEIPYTEVGISDIDAYAVKYQIPGRRSNDARTSWETEEPFADGMTGDETYYVLHVKNIDGSDIDDSSFDQINEKLNDESDDDGWGMTTVPRPLTM